jgi:hypothetical protein
MRWELGPATWPGTGNMWWVLFSTSWLFTLTFSSYVVNLIENDVPKRFSPFDVWKVPETKKTQK